MHFLQTVPTLLIALPAFPQSSLTAAAPGAGGVGNCAHSLRDQNGGECIEASSVPTFGQLFPYVGLKNSFDSSFGSYAGGGWENTATGFGATVGGGFDNEASSSYSTVGGGRRNSATLYGATVSGGFRNIASFDAAVIGGGLENSASAFAATVGGGALNSASFPDATVGGGVQNNASSYYATVAGGLSGTASGSGSTVGGGCWNVSSGEYGTVPGGFRNTASGFGSFSAGTKAKAIHDGAFVWGDRTDVDKESSAADQFSIFASGGTRIFSDGIGSSGVSLAAGAGSWTTVSDRDAKENIEAVDGREVLERVASMPISTWNYKSQDESIRHMGPMAQDFYAAFGLGLGGMGIDTIDPDGVALAAIQGLKAEKDAEIAERDAQIAALLERVKKMESVLATD